MDIYSVISMSKTLNLLVIKYQGNKKAAMMTQNLKKKEDNYYFLALVSGKKWLFFLVFSAQCFFAVLRGRATNSGRICHSKIKNIFKFERFITLPLRNCSFFLHVSLPPLKAVGRKEKITGSNVWRYVTPVAHFNASSGQKQTSCH